MATFSSSTTSTYAPTLAASSSTFYAASPAPRLPPPPPSHNPRSLRRPTLTASTPNLNHAYAQTSRLAPSALSRKTSLATLTPSTLASIPDASENYPLHTVLSDSTQNGLMAPATPGRLAAPGGGDVHVGDVVDVPGNMQGTVRFVGAVQGKNGVFAGVELNPEYLARGKNSGDVDG